MPTTDRTTIKATVDELVAKLRTNLSADPTTAAKPFRRVEIGLGEPESLPRPFLAVRVRGVRAVGVTDDDKVLEISVELRVVCDVLTAEPMTALLDQMGAVEDYLDSIRDTGVLDGAAGFDDRAWSVETSKTTAGSRVAWATATQTLIVKVQRTFNRTAAP